MHYLRRIFGEVGDALLNDVYFRFRVKPDAVLLHRKLTSEHPPPRLRLPPVRCPRFRNLFAHIVWHFITLGEYIFLSQMVSVGNYRGVVSSCDKIFYVGPSTHTWGYGIFVNARYAHFTNSNAKLQLRLRLHLETGHSPLCVYQALYKSISSNTAL